MANIPANATAISRQGGQTVTGSFAGFVGCSNTVNTYIHFTSLKDANGIELVVSGSPAALYLKEGVVYPIYVTTASLDATSANVVFFT
jgi:hypothetical protein